MRTINRSARILANVAAAATATILVLGLSVSTVEATCLIGQPGQLLPAYNDSQGNIACKPGYYCPGFDPSNSTTWPTACLPTPPCAVIRMFGEQCEEAQGTYEPIVCPAGYYCPYNQGIMIKCPDGDLCNVGSTQPEKCPPLTYCNGKNGQNYGLVIYWLSVSLVMFLLWLLYTKVALTSTLETNDDDASSSDNGPSAAWNSNNQRLVDGFKRSRGARPPLRLEFINLAVSVKDLGTGNNKSILKDMSGVMEPGTVTAIMGPSGAGKTTFMMALLGKKDPAWNTQGTLLVNGSDQIAAIRHSIGFVPQDDVLHKELSVFKNIYYSSETRLPKTWTSKQRAVFRSSIIESLGLIKHRDTKIGDEHERGVSGGQRKRASIGVELAAAPLAVFLDEPTSGLDSTTSLEVCSTLKRIAVETQLTVGMVIHQPRVEIWNGLDQVLFIGVGGRVVYQGPQRDAQKYFERKAGIEFPSDANPADVIIDAVGESSDALADLWRTNLESGETEMGKSLARTASIAGLAHSSFVSNPNKLAAEAAKNNKETPGDNFEMTDVVSESPTDQQEDHDDDPKDTGFRGASIFRQLILSHNRYLEKQIATMSALRVEVVVCTLCGLVLGYSFLDFTFSGFYVQPYRRVSPYPATAIFPQMNMYSAMSIALGGAPSGVRVFGNDRFVYYREAAAGYNKLAYFLGTLFSVVYRCLWVTLLFASVYHALAGLPIDFGIFFLSMFLLYWNSYAMGMIVSMVVSARLAPLVSQVLCVCTAILNGFVAYPAWMKQLAFPFHQSQVVMNLWHDLFKHVFEPQFEEWDYAEGTATASLWIMFVSSVIFQIFAFLLMIGMNRERQK